MGSDSRIGSRFLRAGPPYGGSCFPKDTKGLISAADKYKIELPVVKTVIKSNQNRIHLLIKRINKILGNNLKNKKIYGIIDRLIVGSNNVQIIDFKTNSTVPKTANKIPLGILRQMGAYKLAIEEIYPGKEVSCYILWTAIKKIDHLEKDLLDYDNLDGSTS